MKLRRYLALVSLSASSVGCSVLPVVDVYNHSGTPLRIIVAGDSHAIPALGTTAFDYPSAEWGEVRACLNGKMLTYSIPNVPGDYYHGFGILFLRSRIRLQLDPDGSVRVLKRGEDFPIQEADFQPTPFPLEPRMVGGC